MTDSTYCSTQDQTLLHDNVHGEQFGSGNGLRGGKLATQVANEMKMVEGGSGGVKIGTSFAVARTYRRAMKRCEGGGGGGGVREERSAGCRRRLNGGFSHEEVDGANFVAFNADYSAPRHHPPKNN